MNISFWSLINIISLIRIFFCFIRFFPFCRVFFIPFFFRLIFCFNITFYIFIFKIWTKIWIGGSNTSTGCLFATFSSSKNRTSRVARFGDFMPNWRLLKAIWRRKIALATWRILGDFTIRFGDYLAIFGLGNFSFFFFLCYHGVPVSGDWLRPFNFYIFPLSRFHSLCLLLIGGYCG